jgi:5-formyltetrahydrofolate cyclo-ligase
MKSLRTNMRRRRAALDAGDVAAASLSIARRLWRLAPMARARRIGAYAAVGGEVDCAPALARACARSRRIFLPVVHGQQLLFAPVDAGTGMLINRFGIPEPARTPGNCLRAMDLDVVLVPLLAFDDDGHRLGMGGGFYDRSFAFLSRRRLWPHPCFIGLAYEFQHTGQIVTQRWDVPLHAVVTECRVRIF